VGKLTMRSGLDRIGQEMTLSSDHVHCVTSLIERESRSKGSAVLPAISGESLRDADRQSKISGSTSSVIAAQ
jgi:hypothetical protein